MGRRRTGTRHGNVYRSVREKQRNVVYRQRVLQTVTSLPCFACVSRARPPENLSSNDRAESPSLQSQQNAGFSTSRYYELLNKAIDELFVKEEKELENKHVALDPHPYYYNELLEDTIRGREREQDTLSEAFSFTD